MPAIIIKINHNEDGDDNDKDDGDDGEMTTAMITTIMTIDQPERLWE